MVSMDELERRLSEAGEICSQDISLTEEMETKIRIACTQAQLQKEEKKLNRVTPKRLIMFVSAAAAVLIGFMFIPRIMNSSNLSDVSLFAPRSKEAAQEAAVFDSSDAMKAEETSAKQVAPTVAAKASADDELPGEAVAATSEKRDEAYPALSEEQNSAKISIDELIERSRGVYGEEYIQKIIDFMPGFVIETMEFRSVDFTDSSKQEALAVYDGRGTKLEIYFSNQETKRNNPTNYTEILPFSAKVYPEGIQQNSRVCVIQDFAVCKEITITMTPAMAMDDQQLTEFSGELITFLLENAEPSA